jgi:hypothetical protein
LPEVVIPELYRDFAEPPPSPEALPDARLSAEPENAFAPKPSTDLKQLLLQLNERLVFVETYVFHGVIDKVFPEMLHPDPEKAPDVTVKLVLPRSPDS